MRFAPIAIVGQGCVLPGADGPESLWQAVAEGRDLTTAASPEAWGLDAERLAGMQAATDADRVASVRGGFVKGFDRRFDARGYGLEPGALAGLDPVVLWTLHAGRQALGTLKPRSRAGLVLANLSYPTRGFADYARSVWLGVGEGARPENRFCSGLPASLAAAALGLELGGYALDAACASSLYALKLACHRLQDHEADLMLAAAVNRADGLFLQVGFTALGALSPSGRSRPFHAEADGLLPAEGAACVALRRLEDSERDGDPILGVIRGVGISNDGARRGFLVPDPDGQQEALTSAHAMAGVDPADISLLECHATGTLVGDAAELTSASRVFAGARDLPLGSLKSNLGHLITAAGMAGLLKVVGAMAHGVRPPTLHLDRPLASLQGGPLRPLLAPEPWDGRRLAGVSAFGFGGCNAHAVLEAWQPQAAPRIARAAPAAPRPHIDATLAVCAVGVRTGAGSGYDAFRSALFAPPGGAGRQDHHADHVALDIAGLRQPPVDLRAALGQHTLLFAAARDAVDGLPALGRLGVVVGMGCDPDATRYGLRWRNPDRVDDGFCAPLTAVDVLGTMPNLAANRLNAQYDARGFGLSVSAEDMSGLVGLRLAARALAHDEVDAVIVGAAETAAGPVTEAALAALLPADRHRPGDAAVALVVMTPQRAAALDLPVLALVTPGAPATAAVPSLDGAAVRDRFGHCHAAAGLLEVAAAIAACDTAITPSRAGGVPWIAAGARRALHVSVSALGGARGGVLVEASRNRGIDAEAPHLALFAADTRAALAYRVSTGEVGGMGRVRLAIMAEDSAALGVLSADAASTLAAGGTPTGRGLQFGEGAPAGLLAVMFPGAAAAYTGMGRDCLAAFPALTDKLGARFGPVAERVLSAWNGAGLDDPLDQLAGSTLLCQAHALLCLDMLRLEPAAVLGVSSGETNGLVAMGAWRDPGRLLEEIAHSGLYGTNLTGRCTAAAAAWGLPENTTVSWAAWRFRRPRAEIEAAIASRALRVRVTIVNAPSDCVVAGETDDLRRLAALLSEAHPIDLRHPMIVHCPELGPVAETWRRIHTRETWPVEGVRFYANAHNAAYTPDRDGIADALTRQALTTVDFPATLARAWQDGVRFFLELGPRATLTAAVRETLGDRPYHAMSLDAPARSFREQLASVVASLHAAGHLPDPTAAMALFPIRDAAAAERPTLCLPLRSRPDRPDPGCPAGMAPTPPTRPGCASKEPTPMQKMARAPALPPVPSLEGEFDAPAVGPAPHAGDVPRTPGCPVGGADNDAPALAALRVEVARHHTDLDAAHAALSEALAAQERAQTDAVGGDIVPSVGGAHVEPPPRSPACIPAPPPVVPPRTSGPAQLAALDSIAPRQSVAAAVESSRQPSPPTTPVGPRFDRAALEALALGRISDVFGPRFAGQDQYRLQVRMPGPPLLLADRVIGIEGEPMSMGLGRIWTETDVEPDRWYLHDGTMPPGILIESGQADLLLISWLGVDALLKGERAYRLLGCTLTFHGETLPKVGDTLHYEIAVTGHARTGAVRLFFFRYDAWIGDRLCISVRDGQAGFFTEEELAGTGGVLWRPEADTPAPDAQVDAGPCVSRKSALADEDLAAWYAGDAWRCFGTGFERAAAHHRTPVPASRRMRLVDRVTAFDPAGGPWGRGYLCAEADIDTDAWFYDGHFKEDPCMPGTLMADAAFQAQSILMAALGFTIPRDGWRFEPVKDEPMKFICRGQVVPDRPHRLRYEIFVEEIVDGPVPRLYAALLCACDDLKVFHCRRFGVELRPDWPLHAALSCDSAGARLVDPNRQVRGDGRAMLACALGRPSDAFGPMYACFDGPRRAPRLPAPPYLFVDEIAAVDCPAGTVTKGGSVTAIYTPPETAWFYDENATTAEMPFAVLMEVMLQPCGWLASYMGIAARDSRDLRFRNLDGWNASAMRVPRRGGGTLTTRSTLTRHAAAGGTILVFFDVVCSDADGEIMRFETSFGFFDDGAFDSQPGLSAPTAAVGAGDGPPAVSDLALSALAAEPGPRLAAGSLRMLDGIAGFWPAGGAAGLGRIVGHQAPAPDAWYFKAHFYQDPVQPGSLGLEALVQLLQTAMRLKGLHEGMAAPQFEALAAGAAPKWRYRGQVTPGAGAVETEVEITGLAHEGPCVTATALGRLRCDGVPIYEFEGMAVTLRDMGAGQPASNGVTAGSVTEAASPPAVRRAWVERLGIGDWPGQALMTALHKRFVARVCLPDTPDRDAAAAPVIYLANHQTGVESLLFSYVMGALSGRPVFAIAKAEHRDSWLGRLHACLASYPGAHVPPMALHFDRTDPASMPRLLAVAAGLMRDEGYSLLVHVEGTRALRAREPVQRVSGTLFDLVAEAGLAVVPVRFAGGLPVDPPAGSTRSEFPTGFGLQTFHVGALIDPAHLSAMPLNARRDAVAAAINSLGPPLDTETPAPPDPDFAAAVEGWVSGFGLEPARATVLETLARDDAALPWFTDILEAVAGRRTAALDDWSRRFVAWATEKPAG